MSTRRLIALVVTATVAALGTSLIPGTVAPILIEESLAIAAVAVACWGTLRRPPGGRVPLALLTAGIALWVGGDLIWDGYVLTTGEQPSASVADVLYLVGYVFLAAALAAMVIRRAPRQWRDGLIDGLGLTLVAALASWQYLVDLSSDGSTLEKVVWGAYPLADVMVLGAFLWLVFSPGRRGTASLAIGAGIILTLILDTAIIVLPRVAPDFDDRWVNNAYPVTYLLLALAFLHPTVGELTAPAPPVATPLHPARVAFLGIALFGAPFLGALAEAGGGSRLPQWTVLVVTAVVGTVVLARFLRAVRDVERARVELGYQASHDMLTGLVNRAELQRALDGAMRRWADEPSGRTGQVVVFFLDLDRFKPVNDTYGHAAGDELLQRVGERLVEAVRSMDVVGRLGGDEFCIVAERLDPENAPDLARRILDALAEPFVLEVGVAEISASIGIAVPDSPAVSPDELLTQADTALYRVKRAGRNGWWVYDPSTAEDLLDLSV